MACKDCGRDELTKYKCKVCGSELCFTHFSLKKGVCKSCKQGIAIPSPIRRSYLDAFYKCPYKAYMYLMQNYKPDGNLWSNVGNILHDIFELNSLNRSKYSEDDLQQMFIEKLTKYIDENKKAVDHAQSLTKECVVEKMFERGKVSIKNYLKYESTASLPTFTEHHIQFPVIFKDGVGVPPFISATIDRINVFENGDVEIVDYKTGHTVSGPALQSGFQAPVYILAYLHEFGHLPKRFKLLYLEDDNERVFEMVNDDIYRLTVKKNTYDISLKESRQKIVDILQDMSDGKWDVPKTLNGFYCNSFCDIYQAQLCPGKDLNRWNKGKLQIRKE